MTDQTANTPTEPPERTKVRWVLAIGSVVLGLAFLFAAKLVAYEETSLRGDEASFWSGLFVNVGTTLLLAAALIWFERVIVKKVREDRKVAVKEAAEAAAQQTVAAIQPQLDDLDDRLRRRAENAAEERAATANRVATLGTREAVRDALREAGDIHAIGQAEWELGGTEIVGSGLLFIPAGSTLDAPVIEVSLIPGDYTPPQGYAERWEESLTFDYPGRDDPLEPISWEVGVDPEDLFDELRRAMVRVGGGEAARAMSAEAFFANLSGVLGDALSARHAEPGAWMSGSPALEVVADGWVITEAGLEIRGFGIVPRKDFGHYTRGFPSRLIDVNLPEEVPAGLDPAIWAAALERTRKRLVRWSGGF